MNLFYSKRLVLRSWHGVAWHGTTFATTMTIQKKKGICYIFGLESITKSKADERDIQNSRKKKKKKV
ncbi:hypothetical protein BC939DRAFT_456023, partial [Gamsiella multidivaricata]|uniref:uncharacterized protein n=1 Tax=Gamsiella multidivaricata TaxID=101098 RepID=UPI0022210848